MAKMNVRRSLVFSFAQRYAAFAISFVATMALARLLTPSEIGVYSVGAAFVGLAQILRDFGVGRYLVQERNLTDEHVRSALGVGLILGYFIAALLYLASGPVSEFYRAPELKDVLHVLSLSFILIPFTTPAMALLEREMSFNLTFRINLLNALAHAATGVALAAMGLGPLSLAWASFFGVAVSFVVLLVLRPKSVLRRPGLRHWRKLTLFGGQSSLASMISHFGGQAPDLIVGRVLGFQAVGFYSRAQGLVLAFQMNFMRAISDVAFPAYARAHREGRDLKQDYLKGITYVSACAWPFFGVMFVISEPLMVVLFGEQWRPSSFLAQALCMAGAITALWSLAPHLMIGVGRIDRVLRLASTNEICRIGLILLAAMGFGSIEAVAWAQVPSALLGLGVSTWMLSRLIKLRLLNLIHALRPSILVTIASLAAAVAARALTAEASDIIVLPVTTGAAVVAWSAAIYLTKHPIGEELRRAMEFARTQGLAVISRHSRAN